MQMLILVVGLQLQSAASEQELQEPQEEVMQEHLAYCCSPESYWKTQWQTFYHLRYLCKSRQHWL